MLKLFLLQTKKRIPIITILLILGCLFSTIPQLFLPKLYSTISGQFPALHNFFFITLSSFTHTPEMLINHLIGNILVFVIFGSITEIVIGSSRFAFISLLTYLSTTLINYLHSSDSNAGHGASGICWGYQIFFIFILIIFYEEKGKGLFKDIFVIVSLLLMVFDLFGIPILEVLILKRGFFENFGQVLHLISIIVVFPFILLWRKDIENNVLQIISFKKIETQNNIKSIFVILIFILLILNIYGTFRLVFITQKYSDNIIHNINPSIGTDIKKIPEHIMVQFKYPMKMNSEELITTSINYETKEAPIFRTKWINDRTMDITFSRRFIKKENLKLEYLVRWVIEDKIQVEKLINLEYK